MVEGQLPQQSNLIAVPKPQLQVHALQACLHAVTHAYIHTYMHRHAYIHAYMHAYTLGVVQSEHATADFPKRL